MPGLREALRRSYLNNPLVLFLGGFYNLGRYVVIRFGMGSFGTVEE